MINKIRTTSYGVLFAFLLAMLATLIERILPIHFIGSSIIALFLGILINPYFKPKNLNAGLDFTSKKILRIAIILLGASLNVNTLLTIGRMSLSVMIFTLITCFLGGYLLGKALGLDWKLSSLISAGTGICGGSAIASIAPVIDAKDSDIAYALSATFIFDVLMIVLFPIMGVLLNLNDIAYGLWAGTAVNDTSSVVAASYAYSEGAGDFATLVKLTRTLSIIPTVIVFAFINLRLTKQNNSKSAVNKINYYKLFPWFIAFFVVLSILFSIGFIPEGLSVILKNISRFLMVMSLAAIGMKTSFKSMKNSGIRPLLHGFIISLAVVVVSIVVIYTMGLV